MCAQAWRVKWQVASMLDGSYFSGCTTSTSVTLSADLSSPATERRKEQRLREHVMAVMSAALTPLSAAAARRGYEASNRTVGNEGVTKAWRLRREMKNNEGGNSILRYSAFRNRRLNIKRLTEQAALGGDEHGAWQRLMAAVTLSKRSSRQQRQLTVLHG